jgi:hypothetical protein
VGGFCWRIDVAARVRETLERRGVSRRNVEENSLLVVWLRKGDGMADLVIYDGGEGEDGRSDAMS